MRASATNTLRGKALTAARCAPRRVVTDRWQKFSELAVTPETLRMLAASCDEFLVRRPGPTRPSAGSWPTQHDNAVDDHRLLLPLTRTSTVRATTTRSTQWVGSPQRPCAQLYVGMAFLSYQNCARSIHLTRVPLFLPRPPQFRDEGNISFLGDVSDHFTNTARTLHCSATDHVFLKPRGPNQKPKLKKSTTSLGVRSVSSATYK